jgi:hypothetical protein
MAKEFASLHFVVPRRFQLGETTYIDAVATAGKHRATSRLQVSVATEPQCTGSPMSRDAYRKKLAYELHMLGGESQLEALEPYRFLLLPCVQSEADGDK